MDAKSAASWHDIPRHTIDWFPTVAADRCVGCGVCVTSCGRGVYAFDYEQNEPVVVAPEMCMVGCTTCATICTQDAIEFPFQGYIRHLNKDHKVLRQAKDMLRAAPEKYDVRKRQVPNA
jgi:NAD-dependent dihydropyrimidine dehydrogenase PreA subunit